MSPKSRKNGNQKKSSTAAVGNPNPFRALASLDNSAELGKIEPTAPVVAESGGNPNSESSTVVVTQGSAIAVPEVEPDDSIADIFIIAGKIQALLSGISNKKISKVMNMVGSLHGIRAIPSDRPIGQSTVGTTKVGQTKPPVKVKGKPTPRAEWKQTDAYKQLTAQRTLMVTTIKAHTPSELSKTSHVEDLREIERKLKALHPTTAGNH